MVKKVIKKKVVKKKIIISKAKAKSSETKLKEKNVERILIENFVSLQKVMTNLSVRFDELSNQISKLLELFEISANALAKKDINFTKPMDEKKIMDKLESIVDQNKTIARGLTLMHERVGGEEEKIPPAPVKAIPTSAPPTRPTLPPVPGTPRGPAPPKEEYQKSPFSKGF